MNAKKINDILRNIVKELLNIEGQDKKVIVRSFIKVYFKHVNKMFSTNTYKLNFEKNIKKIKRKIEKFSVVFLNKKIKFFFDKRWRYETDLFYRYSQCYIKSDCIVHIVKFCVDQEYRKVILSILYQKVKTYEFRIYQET